MIQINLVPDVKQEYLKARRMRNLVVSISIVVGIVAVSLAVLMGVLLGGQIVREGLIDGSIKSEQAKYAGYPDVNNLLTIQNQLTKIDELNNSRTVMSRLFGVLEAINPKGDDAVRFSSIRISPEDKKMTLEGVAKKGYSALEVLKKTIANTKMQYKEGDEQQTVELSTLAEVIESGYGEDGDGARVVRFTMSVDYNEYVFSNSVKNVTIVSPTGEKNVTDSRLGVPESLFTNPVDDIEEGAQNGQ